MSTIQRRRSIARSAAKNTDSGTRTNAEKLGRTRRPRAPQQLPLDHERFQPAYPISDATLNFGKVQPDFNAAEMGTLGANRGCNASAKMTRRADVAGKLGMHFADLRNFVHGRVVDFFLRVKACAHGPFVKEMEERTRLHEANGFCVGQKVEGDLRRHA